MSTRHLLSAAVALCAAAAALALPAPAEASELIARYAKSPRLSVDARGRALVTYRVRGRVKRVVAWGAIDARPPTRGKPQVRFRLRYGGRISGGRCLPYDGPPLAWLVVACKAPDGTYWALQSWHRLVPNYGAPATRGPRELRLSHWSGELATLAVAVGWRSGVHRLTGSLAYRGRPVHGFGATPRGRPLDRYGRNVYVDTLGSRYGKGWRRENGFLTRRPTGNFCYGMWPRRGRPAGMGTAYRATVIGPGVTPDVFWSGTAPAGPVPSPRGRCR